MYAIVEIGGHQYKVAENDVLFVDKQIAEGGKLTFDKVLLIKEGNGSVKVGTPVVKGAEVTAKLLDTVKSDKVLIFKKKRRKGYQKLNGHRQVMSQIEIESISVSGSGSKKKTEAKKETTSESKATAPKKEKSKQASADLNSMTVAELRDLAKEKGLTGYSSLKKAELIEALK
ncbi:MAG: 50S ribosomal protein L21 [Balneolaceae bacterium]